MLQRRIAGKKLLWARNVGCAAIFVGSVIAACTLATVQAERKAGRPVGDFTLVEPGSGRKVSSRDFGGSRAVVLVFLGMDCPISNLILPRLTAMADAYRSRGVKFVGVNSNDHELANDVAEYARSHGLNFPMYMDERHAVADLLRVDRLCEVLVIDERGRLRYQGALDDQYGLGTRKVAPTRAYVAEALDAVLRGSAVKVPQTPVFGCLIERSKPAAARRTVAVSSPVKSAPARSEKGTEETGAVGPVSYSADRLLRFFKRSASRAIGRGSRGRSRCSLIRRHGGTPL